MIQRNAPDAPFSMEGLAPGIQVFGLSFITLFLATVLSKDRSSSFLMRLFSTPMKPWDFILGFMVLLIPLALLQGTMCFVTPLLLGLDWSINIVWEILLMIPMMIFYIAFGLLCGSIFNDKQVGGICGGYLVI